jgi:hypothetical protein
MAFGSLGVAIKCITAGGQHPAGWVRYLKCEKFDHNIVRTLPMIQFFDSTNIPMDFGRQAQAVKVAGQCNEVGETLPDGTQCAGKDDLEGFAWRDWSGDIAVYWVENGTWYYVKGKVDSLSFDYDPVHDFWNFRLSLQYADATKAGSANCGKQPGAP